MKLIKKTRKLNSLKSDFYKSSVIIFLLLLTNLIINGQSVCSEMPANKLSHERIRELAVRSAEWSMANHLTDMSYQSMCSAYGILMVAAVTENEDLRKGVEEILKPELLQGRNPHRNNAEKNPAHRWFGFIPLELYKQTRNPSYLTRGLEMAEEQYLDPDPNGMPAYTPRAYIDDIYGATVMQSLAYECTGEGKYLDRAVKQVLYYSDKFMQQNGLFLHSPQKSPFYWGRGNGWCAAAYAEILNVMPLDHPQREAVLTAYRKMMNALLKYHHPDGIWCQLLDDHNSFPETSCTAMFIYSMTEGVKNGWLPAPFEAAVLKTWETLIDYVDEDWRLREVCIGTGFGNREFYLNRPRETGNAHGQAPLLWAAASMLNWLQK